MKEVFIQGTCAISPQPTFEEGPLLEEVQDYEAIRLPCVEPVYKTIIDPRKARRMSKVVKMSVAAALLSLQRAEVEQPDAILTGTGIGCMRDTEKFLLSLLEDESQTLTPTSFIQSIHNTIGGQIALMLGCHAPNFTYAHRGTSFESALLDGTLTLGEGNAEKVLVGGFDEMTDNLFTLYSRIGRWKKKPLPNRELFGSATPGALAGEGAAFFVLSGERDARTLAALKGVQALPSLEGTRATRERVERFLSSHGLAPDDLDVVIYGYSGDKDTDIFFDLFREELFRNALSLGYKHLFGESHTASSLGMWLATHLLHQGRIPGVMRLDDGATEERPLQRVLLFDQYYGASRSLFLLER